MGPYRNVSVFGAATAGAASASESEATAAARAAMRVMRIGVNLHTPSGATPLRAQGTASRAPSRHHRLDLGACLLGGLEHHGGHPERSRGLAVDCDVVDEQAV